MHCDLGSARRWNGFVDSEMLEQNIIENSSTASWLITRTWSFDASHSYRPPKNFVIIRPQLMELSCGQTNQQRQTVTCLMDVIVVSPAKMCCS